MDNRARFDDYLEAVTTLVEGRLASVHTAVPCTIVSVDRERQTAVLQPTIKARRMKPDGSQEWVSYPPISDAPMQFPTGGGVAMTFPVRAGDECLAVVPSRSQDGWQQSGGEQQQVDLRMHDISNAFCLLGFRSNPNALQNVPDDAVQIRTDDGNTVISLKGDEVSVKASSSTHVVTPSTIASTVGSTSVKVSANRVDLGGDGGQKVMTEGGPSSIVYAKV
ncbi:Gp138 family membrane-puncturing spike protein [Xanthobacter sediminis]|uniref:Gp138 family membrane-puncturing spike protein n=1 Tax=Xanthobacter sediminis TaxID=3119926 RepID=UPI0037289FF9